ncbi:hypothetical protein PVAND_014067 [Polypedilum vanderplanki]|uniref:Sulfatase N-terminal domain-containing protein n=1 Tax=Polypedilum vanderplanki TaxID=319348 RepID=A0A9J6CRM8_POLVA|nr:hypothetical protein PVAND_014067 [Polypedilum vanderplanki]
MNLFILLLLFLSLTSALSKPNFVIILTDDQDLLLDSLKPLQKIEKYLINNGVIFLNAFTSSPICCPSRSSFLTGNFAHNTNTFNNSLNGGCYSNEWIENHELRTFPAILNNHGYRTFYAGKYLNQYYSNLIPQGYDQFYGLHGNSKYFNYTLNENGNIIKYGDNQEDYYTNVIKSQILNFLSNQTKDEPFIAIVSTPSCHAPFTPEEKFNNSLSNFTAPRTSNFNVGSRGLDKHWLMTMKPKELSQETIAKIDEFYRMRLESLLSVDDMVEEIIEKLSEQNILDETFIIFTSDNGYHLGNWAMPWDKRLPYETDIKIPLIIRGPNVPVKKVVQSPVALIDLAPTILNWAEINYKSENFDGQSFDKLINEKFFNENFINERQILIEHWGEGNVETFNPECPWKKSQRLSECQIEAECKCQDSWNNTYVCVRHLSKDINFLYCTFHDREHFNEAYDLGEDEFQLNNVAYDILPSIQARYQIIVENLRNCLGEDCKIVKNV